MNIRKNIFGLVMMGLLFVGVYHTVYSQTANTLDNGLVGYWKFDTINTSAWTTPDSSGANNTGKVGTTSRLVAGKFDQAMKYDENVRNQYMTTSQNFSSSQWSVSTWVNPEFPVPVAAPYNGLITFFSTDPGGQLLGIQKNGVYMYTTKITSYDFASNPGWHHIVVTYDGANLSATVDNSAKASIPYKNLMESNISRHVGVNVPAGTYHMFKGLIDETRLYNRALTTAEITALFNNTTSGPVAAIVAPIAQAVAPVIQPAAVAKPSSVIFSPKNTTPKDLFLNIQNEIDSRIGSLGASDTTKNLWNQPRGNAAGGWTKNTSVWTGAIDWSGVSPWNNDFVGNAAGYYKAGTLVSPRHIIFANHFRIANGSDILFIDKNGQHVNRKIADFRTITGTDISVAALDSDVPDTVTFYPVFKKTDLQTYLKDGSVDVASLNLPFVLFDRDDHLVVRSTNKNKLFDAAATTVNHDISPAGKRAEFNEDVVLGDSGNPGFVLVGGQPVLIFTNFDYKSSPSISYFYDQINLAMTSLGGGYQLSTINLSGFTKPTTAIAPTKAITSNIVATTDKLIYKVGDTMQFKATFTLDADWISWMKNSNQTDGIVQFTLKDAGSTALVRNTQKSAITAASQTFTYDWPIPENPALADKTYTLEVQISDSKNGGVLISKVDNIKINPITVLLPPPSDSLDLSKGLKAYWKFDTLSGGTIPDESGSGNSGTVQNGALLVGGKFGKAIELNMDTTKAQTAEQSVDMKNGFGSAQWTVSLWVNPAKPFPPAAELPSKGVLGFLSTDPGSQLLDIQKDGVYMFYTKILAYDFLNNPGWHHIVVSYDGVELAAVIDGSIRGSIPFAKNILANTTAIRKIGILNTTKTFSFKGAIDEFRIYNRLLSLKEVATLYNPDAKVTGELTVTKVYPTADLPSWTGYTHIELNLNRNGWCKASTVSGKSYEQMEIKMNDIAISKIAYNVLYTKPGDTFTYYIRCSDTAGNETPRELPVTFSIDNDTDSPGLLEVSASAVRDTTADIVWSTDELANSRVEYSAAGKGTLLSVDENAYGYPHAQLLTGLTPDTTYTYKVISADKSGNKSSVTRTFKTRAPAGKTYYVSPTGNDTSGDGTIASPYKTLERARDVVRTLRPLPVGGVQILLRGGVYPRTTAFVLSAADSGTTDAPIRYRAYNNEEVRITGAKEITGFTATTNSRVKTGGVLQVDLKANGVTDFGTRQNSGAYLKTMNSPLGLIFQDKPMILARYPNENNSDLYSELIKINTTPDASKTFTFTDVAGRLSRWASFADVWVHGNWFFNHRHSVLKTTSITKSGTNTYTVTAPGDQTGMKANRPFFFMNVLEELDTPGEWYLDNGTGILYFYPPAGINTSKAYVTVANDLVDINGTSNTTFTGIIFENARGKAFDIDQNASNIMVENSVIRNVSMGAWIAGKHNGIWGSKIYNTEDNGVVLFGGKDTTLEGGYNYVENSEIYNFATLNKSYRAAVNLTGIDTFVTTLGPTSGVANRARYNYIHDGPHFGILGAGNNLLVDSNEIARVCKETIDCGAIYFVAPITRRGSMIKYNYVHNIYGFDFEKIYQLSAVAIYIDNDTGGVSVFGNVIDNVDVAILGNGGRDNEIQNNAASNVTNRGIYFDASGLTFTNKNFRIPIVAVSKTTPIEITMIRPHMNSSDYEYRPKNTVKVAGAEGETGINGEWKIETNPATPNKMTLLGTVPTGDYTGGGYLIQTDTTLNYLAKYNYTKAPYATFYPRLTRALLEVDDAEPKGILIERNAFQTNNNIRITPVSQKYVKFDSSNIIDTTFSPSNLQPLLAKGFKPIQVDRIGLIKGDILPPVVVVDPPGVTSPTTKITSNLAVTSDKTVYKPGETARLSSTFILDPEWVSYLKSINQNQAELKFVVTDADRKILAEKPIGFAVANAPVTLTFDWITPTDATYAGKVLAVQTAVYNTTKLSTETKNTTISLESKINTAPAGQNAAYILTDKTVVIALVGVDAQNDTLTYTPNTLTLPNGTLTRTAEGKYTYTLKTPAPTTSFVDTFTYTVSDGKLVSPAATVTVKYTAIPPVQFVLTTSKIGLGKITANQIDCGQTCQASYVKDAKVTLTATPDAGYGFTAWSGACTGATCTVTMDAAKSATATFTKINTAPIPQNGGATVVGNTASISLVATDPQNDTLTYTPNKLTLTYGTLTRTAEGKYTYTLKTPAPTTSITDSFTFTASDGKLTSASSGTFTITYIPPIYTLTVTTKGNGKVTGNGIDCGATCQKTFAKGSVVTLTPAPISGNTFTGWIGSCTGTGACTFVVDGDEVVSANFIVTNTAPTAQSGVFTVVGTTANIVLVATDPQNDTLTYTPNKLTLTYGTLTRTAEGKYTYTLKTPAPTTSITDSFTFTASDPGGLKSAAATIDIKFTIIPPTNFSLTVSKAGKGVGTVTAPNLNCGQTCQATYTKDTRTILTATPIAGSSFGGWSDTSCTGATCAVSMTGDKSITATFTIINTAPKAKDVTFTTDSTGATLVILDAVDSQGDAVTYTPSKLTLNYGTLTRLSEGRYNYVLANKATSGATETLTYTAKDAALTSTPANITIKIPVKDADNDGVPDGRDLCANTPLVLKSEINTYGCIKPKVSILDIKPTFESSVRNLIDLEIGKTNVAKIKYTQPVDVYRDTEQLDIDSNILISNKKVQIKSASAPELNKPAVITFYGVTEKNPKILRDGVECKAPQCIVSPNVNGVVTVTVNGFSTYELVEGDVPSTPNTAPVATNITAIVTGPSTDVSIVLSATDAEGDALTYTANSSLLNYGSISGSGRNYVYTYTQSDRLSEYTDRFTFTASDGKTVSNTGTVTVTIEKVQKTLYDQVVDVIKKVTRSGGGGGGGGTRTPVTTPVTPVVPVTTPVVPKTNTTVTTSSRVLSVGTVGEDVRTLQKYLNTHGFVVAAAGTGSPGKESTYFGPATKAAVMKYQISKGINPVGYVGAVTRSAMGLATASVSVPTKPVVTASTTPVSTAGISFTRDLKVGSVGADVKKLQQILNTKGFILATIGAGSPGKESTTFGPKTAEALKKFQISKGIKPVGYVGAVTRKVLNTI